MIDKNNKLILGIMVVAILLAINFHQVKRHFIQQEIARAVFIDAGVPVDDYMKGVDFSKPVRMFKVKEGDTFLQYQIPGNPQGNFYGLIGSKPDELGIYDKGYDPKTGETILKEKRIYVAVKDFEVLASYAREIIDNWSTPENEAKVGGSKVQFFTTCKECFILWR